MIMTPNFSLSPVFRTLSLLLLFFGGNGGGVVAHSYGQEPLKHGRTAEMQTMEELERKWGFEVCLLLSLISCSVSFLKVRVFRISAS
jgi:hypothetical protein